MQPLEDKRFKVFTKIKPKIQYLLSEQKSGIEYGAA